MIIINYSTAIYYEKKLETNFTHIADCKARLERAKSEKGIQKAQKDLDYYLKENEKFTEWVEEIKQMKENGKALMAQGNHEAVVAYYITDNYGMGFTTHNCYNYGNRKAYATLEEAILTIANLYEENGAYTNARIEIRPKGTIEKIKRLEAEKKRITAEIKRLEEGE